MKQNLKKYIKTNIIGFIFTLILIISIDVYSAITFSSNEVSYSNGMSGLKSTNIQGAIDELYSKCSISESLNETALKNVPIVSFGDGLYKDEYEEGRYFYKGTNPNNYITFNNEQWRIISVEPDKTIKIIKNASIGNIAWDTKGGKYGSDDWSRPADLNTYLNGTYYNGLNSTAQSQIVSKDWSIGDVTWHNNNLIEQINDENKYKWTGKVALPTLSEYIRSNSNQRDCESLSLNSNNDSSCKNTTWMLNPNISSWWTLTAVNDVYIIYAYSIRYDNTIINKNVNMVECVRPTVYLSSKIKITGGNGSSSSPYQISL